MNKNLFRIIFTVIALIVFGGWTTLAQTKPQPEPENKPASHQAGKKGQETVHAEQSKTAMSAMISEPHQVLAMVYRQNIGTFAKALGDQAQVNSSLSADFARAIAGEISRSFDKAEEHDREHVKTMSLEMRSKTTAMMKAMDTYRSKLKDAIATLEKDVRDYTLKSKQIAIDSTEILKYLDEMSKMYNRN